MVGHFRPLKIVNISSKTKNLVSRENSTALLGFFCNGSLKKRSKNSLVQTTYTAKYSLYVTAPGFRLAGKVSPVNKIFEDQLT